MAGRPEAIRTRHQGRDGCYIPPVAAKGERNPDVSGALAIGSLGSIKPPILIVE